MKLDPTQWNPDQGVVLPGNRGFNFLTQIPKTFKLLFPQLNAFEMGFFIEADLPTRLSGRWERLNLKEHFSDEKEAKELIRRRIGCTIDEDGFLRYQDNYVCVMGKDYRKAQYKVKAEQDAKMFKSATQQMNVKTEQMSGNKTTTELQQWRIVNEPKDGQEKEPEEKRGPGRPRKEE